MIDYRNYCGFDELLKVEEIMYDVVFSINWRDLKSYLLSNSKESDKKLWWYVIQGNNKQVFFESNLESSVESYDDSPLTNESEYLHINLTEGCVPELIKLKECAIVLPGVKYVGLHFLSLNSYVESHTDTGTINVLFNIKTSSGGKLIVDNQKFTFQNRQIFAFDGDLLHSVENKFGNDWIMFVLRISKNTFY